MTRTIAEIDHLLTYVADPAEAAALFVRMGFTLSPVSRIEAMGITNYLV
ncbi:VOC family protein, partial [Vibrio parahaemolyticus]